MGGGHLVVSADNFFAAATAWLRAEECDVCCMGGQISHSDFVTWRQTLTSWGISIGKAGVTQAVPWSFAKSLLVNGNKVHVHGKHLEEALAPYAQASVVLGLKLARVTQGNTRVMPFLIGDLFTAEDIAGTLDDWLAQADALQDIGRSLGQTYGEVMLGLWSLGLTGMRVQQPIELYPIIVFFDHASFTSATTAILDQSIRESYHKRDTVGTLAFPKAPVFVQAIFVCVPTMTVAALNTAKETRRAWKHYKKPKLASRVFNETDLTQLLRLVTH